MTANDSPQPPAPAVSGAVVRPRDRHNISRRDIDPAALRVLYRLHRAGYDAYLVGGSVRDLLLGHKPKDFDVGTNATPRQIKGLFRQAYIIGRRFRLVHVKFGDKVVETCTFRRQETTGLPFAPAAAADSPDGEDSGEGERHGRNRRHDPRIADDELFGTPAEDAFRRDFTVNGLFYDIATLSVIDHVGGLEDLADRRLRAIGDPDIRFVEDPVRMLRAVRFAARLGFRIESATGEALKRHHAQIVHASPPRLFEEMLRLFAFQSAAPAFRLLWDAGLMADLLPEVAAHIDRCGGGDARCWPLLAALDRNDTMLPTATPAMQFAALFWEPLAEELRRAGAGSSPRRVHNAMLALVGPAAERLRFPRRLRHQLGAILVTQSKFDENPSEPARRRFAEHDFFPASLAFRELRHAALGLPLGELNPWRLLHDQQADRYEWLARNAPPASRFEPLGSGKGPLAGFEAVERLVIEEETAADMAPVSPEPLPTPADNARERGDAPFSAVQPADAATANAQVAPAPAPSPRADNAREGGNASFNAVQPAAAATADAQVAPAPAPAPSPRADNARERGDAPFNAVQPAAAATADAQVAPAPAPTPSPRPDNAARGNNGKSPETPDAIAPTSPMSRSARRRRNRRLRLIKEREKSSGAAAAPSTPSPTSKPMPPTTAPIQIPPADTPPSAVSDAAPLASTPKGRQPRARREASRKTAAPASVPASASKQPAAPARAPKTSAKEKTPPVDADATPVAAAPASAKPPTAKKPARGRRAGKTGAAATDTPISAAGKASATAKKRSSHSGAPTRAKSSSPKLDPDAPLTVAAFFPRRPAAASGASAPTGSADAENPSSPRRQRATTGLEPAERYRRSGRGGRGAPRTTPAVEADPPPRPRGCDDEDRDASGHWMDEL